MVDTIKFSQMTNAGDLSPNQVTPGLLSGSNVLFNNPWTFLSPGTTAERPVPNPAMYYRLRLNTTLEVYEYYDPTTLVWAQLSGTGTGTVNPGAVNDIAFYAASGQSVSPISAQSNSVLVSNASQVPSMSTTLPTGLSIPSAAITASTAALLSGSVIASPSGANDIVNKSYADSLFASGVQSLTGTINQITFSSPTGNITASLPQSIALGSTPTFAGLTLTSIPLGISSGGTNRNSLPLTPTASTYSAWDVNRSLSANSFIPGFTATVTSAGNTVLTVASTQIQEFTGSSTQTVTLPIASTLSLGQPYIIINNSTGNVTVQSSGGNTIQVMATNTALYLNLIVASGTTASSWNATYAYDGGGGVFSITGTTNQVIASASTGNVTLSLPQSIATSSAVTFGSVSFSSTSEIIGTTTNNNAAAGSVGEEVASAVTGAINFTTSSVAQNMQSISLTAGDWSVYGSFYVQAGTTVPVGATVSFSTTSATQGTPGAGYFFSNNFINGTGTTFSIVKRFSLASTTTIYLVGQMGWTGTAALFSNAQITARRVR